MKITNQNGFAIWQYQFYFDPTSPYLPALPQRPKISLRTHQNASVSIDGPFTAFGGKQNFLEYLDPGLAGRPATLTQAQTDLMNKVNAASDAFELFALECVRQGIRYCLVCYQLCFLNNYLFRYNAGYHVNKDTELDMFVPSTYKEMMALNTPTGGYIIFLKVSPY